MMKPKPSRRAGSAPTISDVAKRAGVSPMTVSRVINGESNVRPTTREVVNAAISALNYAPNPAARSLAGAAQVRIGILYSNPSAAYLSEFLVGGLDQASRSDAQIVVEKCEIGDHELEAARHLLAGGIDGIILPLGFGVLLWIAWRRRDLLHGYRYPVWLLAAGVAAWALTLYLAYNAITPLADL